MCDVYGMVCMVWCAWWGVYGVVCGVVCMVWCGVVCMVCVMCVVWCGVVCIVWCDRTRSTAKMCSHGYYGDVIVNTLLPDITSMALCCERECVR